MIIPENVTAHQIRVYLHSLELRGLAPASQHSAARAIRVFFNFLVGEGILNESPMQRVKMPRQEKKILPALSIDDVHRLLDACTNLRDETIILTLLDTGCRASEFLALNIGDVDIRGGRVLVRKGKGRKQRVVFLSKNGRRVMRQYLRNREDAHVDMPLWVSLTSVNRLTDSGLRQLLQRLGKKAGVQHSNPHSFRRTFALWSLRAGMNIYALQQLMGHSDLSILRWYLALTENDLETAHRSHSPVDRLFASEERES